MLTKTQRKGVKIEPLDMRKWKRPLQQPSPETLSPLSLSLVNLLGWRRKGWVVWFLLLFSLSFSLLFLMGWEELYYRGADTRKGFNLTWKRKMRSEPNQMRVTRTNAGACSQYLSFFSPFPTRFMKWCFQTKSARWATPVPLNPEMNPLTVVWDPYKVMGWWVSGCLSSS